MEPSLGTEPKSSRVTIASSDANTLQDTTLKNTGAALSWPAAFDWGLLCLRIWLGLSLFLKHGWEKPVHFSQMAQHFPDPLHIGPVPSLIFALASDAICSILVLLGLGTRWAALVVLVNIFVAWSFITHFQFFGRGAGSGEAMVLYLGGFLVIAIMGPGRFSVDSKLGIGTFARTQRRSKL
jgi:putative oxidoreductase